MKYHRRLQNVTHLAVLASLAGYFFAASIAHTATSEWISSEGGEVRIVATKPQADGTVPAILDIRLKPGWKTYWKEPGASGIPPQVTVDPSSGITFSGLSFPAPKTFDDGVVRYIGYDQSVAFPLSLKTKTTGDLTLKASVFLGICKDICIPVQADLSVALPTAQVENPLERARIDDAVAALPESPSDTFRMTGAWFDSDGKHLHVSFVTPSTTIPSTPELFVSGSMNFAVGKVENIVTINGVTSAKVQIRHMKGARGSVGFVMRAGDRSMQTTISFD